MSNLAKQMNDLVEYAGQQLEWNRTNPDPHLIACQATADHFKLWDEQHRFPLWLSHVVAGIGREKGILQ